MDQPENSFMSQKLGYFAMQFNYKAPSVDQLNAKIFELSKQIMIMQAAAMVVSTILAVIAYKNAWIDPGPDSTVMVLNPFCMVWLGLGLIVMLLANMYVNRIKVLRQFLQPSEQRLVSFDPNVQQYINEVKGQGRKYLTVYETWQLFPQAQPEGERINK